MIGRLKLLLAGFLLIGSLGAAGTATVAAFDLFPNDDCMEAKNNAADGEKPVVCEDGNASQSEGNNSLFGANGIFAKIVNILAIVIGIAAVIVIIVAGIQYMISTGDPTKVNNAKNAILYAVIGIAIAVVARQIILFIIGKLG